MSPCLGRIPHGQTDWHCRCWLDIEESCCKCGYDGPDLTVCRGRTVAPSTTPALDGLNGCVLVAANAEVPMEDLLAMAEWSATQEGGVLDGTYDFASEDITVDGELPEGCMWHRFGMTKETT